MYLLSLLMMESTFEAALEAGAEVAVLVIGEEEETARLAGDSHGQADYNNK
jgi:hypothetical protein